MDAAALKVGGEATHLPAICYSAVVEVLATPTKTVTLLQLTGQSREKNRRFPETYPRLDAPVRSPRHLDVGQLQSRT